MIVGFTGTQHGMTERQQELLAFLLSSWKPRIFRHGVCIGADEQAHEICLKYSTSTVRELFPGFPSRDPTDLSKRAIVEVRPSIDIIHEGKPFLCRNRDIVLGKFGGRSNVLVVVPDGMKEKRWPQRSGTWSTRNYARSQRIPRIILLP